MSQFASADMELPPPAYELTQEDWDRKVSTAVEQSLHISENHSAPSGNADDDGFEVWDEAAFEAAAARLAQAGSGNAGGAGSSSRPLPALSHPRQASPLPQKAPLPPIEPLRIVKNAQPPEKERPSWYEEAGLGQAGSSSSSSAQAAAPSGRPAPSPSPAAHPGASMQRRPTLPPDFDTATRVHSANRIPSEVNNEASQQPPPFSPTGPSLDGPPYEEVEEVVLAYARHHDSRSPSPLRSPDVAPAPLPAHRPQPQYNAMAAPPSRPETPRATVVPSVVPPPPPSTRPHTHHHNSMPPPRPRPSHTMGPRPTSNYTVSSQVANTTIAFDPSAAYGKSSHIKLNHSSATSPYNASAFYSSAIAATLNPAGTTQSGSYGKPAQPSQGYAPNVVHKPQPHHAATYGGPPTTWQSSQHYQTAAQQYAAQHGYHGHSQSSSQQFNQAPGHYGAADNSDAASVYSSHSSHAQAQAYNPTSFGQGYHNASGTYHAGGQPNYQASYPASTYAQPASAPTTTQTSSFPAQQNGIPPPPPMSAPHHLSANVHVSSSLSPPSSHSPQYNPHNPPNSAPPTFQSISSPPTLSPQNSYTPTSYGSSPTGSAQVSPSLASSGNYGQFAQAQTATYAPTTYNVSSAPPSAGHAQPAQYNTGYLPPGAAAPAGRNEGNGSVAGGALEYATAQTELQTARVGRWSDGLEMATAGLNLANTVLGLMNNNSGGDNSNNNSWDSSNNNSWDNGNNNSWDNSNYNS